MNLRIRVELSIMMFIQFFVWGAWYVTLATYLQRIGFTDPEIGWAYTTPALAAIAAPFFIGMIADRFFPAQVVLGVLHLTGGVLMYWASAITSPFLFTIILLGYSLCYMPTLALVNAISFNQMSSPQQQFPAIRVLGTIGWIIAGWVLSYMNWEPQVYQLKLAAWCSFGMGVYSFFLPNTPPKSTGKKVTVRDVLGLDALKLLKDPSFAIFVLSSFLVSIPLAFYYTFTNPFLNEAGLSSTAAMQTGGQMSEVFFMLLMPILFRRLGVKKMLLAGMCAWVVRYVLFAFGNSETLIFMFWIGILLHGLCYDFFFVTGQIYVDRKAPKEIQASAQGFIALVTYGAGLFFGNIIAGKVVGFYKLQTGHDWETIWLIPAVMAAFVAVIFLLAFHEGKEAAAQPEERPIENNV